MGSVGVRGPAVGGVCLIFVLGCASGYEPEEEIEPVEPKDGNCAPEFCNGVDDDCDGMVDEDFDRDTDPNHCGNCGTSCALPNAMGECVDGVCAKVQIQCDEGFGDCDGDPETGCEVAVVGCGQCGVQCDLDNATSECVDGSCALADCDAGYHDCDGDVDNGCEADLGSEDHCGGCGVACAADNAFVECNDGACQFLACLPGFDDCNGDPVDGCELAIDTPSDCGMCGLACDPGHATGRCDDGVCSVQSCDAGWGDCSVAFGGCETPLDTVSNCGSCGTSCDLVNAEESCSSGSCEIVDCASGHADCNGVTADGCEAALTTVADCGGCGVPCAFANASAGCAGGFCQMQACDAGFADCNRVISDGCESSLDSATSCGSCGVICDLPNAIESCTAGVCGILRCESSWADCDGIPDNGCETLLGTSSDCGACGVSCQHPNGTGTCAASVCDFVCDTLHGDCNMDLSDGCETNLASLTHCGGCNVGCSLTNATASCATGTCEVAACDAGHLDCDGDPSNGCEDGCSQLVLDHTQALDWVRGKDTGRWHDTQLIVGFATQRAMIKWSLSTVPPGSVIDRAVLHVYSHWSQSSSGSVNLHRVADDSWSGLDASTALYNWPTAELQETYPDTGMGWRDLDITGAFVTELAGDGVLSLKWTYSASGVEDSYWSPVGSSSRRPWIEVLYHTL